MKQKYDFSKGKRGRIIPPQPEPRGKTRITIRLDEDLVDHFLREADASGGATGYQTLINEALRQHVEGKAPKLEETLRRVVREELRAAS
ncbi:MAG: BrnA antitoxin family protein [Terracidiphilus sp.]